MCCDNKRVSLPSSRKTTTTGCTRPWAWKGQQRFPIVENGGFPARILPLATVHTTCIPQWTTRSPRARALLAGPGRGFGLHRCVSSVQRISAFPNATQNRGDVSPLDPGITEAQACPYGRALDSCATLLPLTDWAQFRK